MAMRLDRLKAGQLIEGLTDDGAVRILYTRMLGDNARQVTYRNQNTSPSNVIIFSSQEQSLQRISERALMQKAMVYRKVLLMVAELHIRGFQHIRIAPDISPSGLSWRCSIAPITNILKSNGAAIAKRNHLAVHYSSGQEGKYFDLPITSPISPSQLATKFLNAFPDIAQAGYGRDWPYAGWYQEMLGLTYPNLFPLGDLIQKDGRQHLECMDYGGQSFAHKVLVPAPPPGEAQQDEEDT